MEGLDDDSVSELVENLLNNTSVKKVLLDGNEMQIKSFISIRNLLAKNNSINYLSINFVNLCELGAKTIVPGLIHNNCLEFLSVSGNDLFSSGIEGLAMGLKQNRSITTLILTENAISEAAGSNTILDIMSINPTITHLDLSFNYINNDGTFYLAEMISRNTTIKNLILERNCIEDVGCEAIATALEKNSTLKHLSLASNIIETDGLLALTSSLLSNNTLTTLDVRNNIFDIDSEIALQQLTLQKNRKLLISWRKEPSKDDPPTPLADINSIIKYFGPRKIVELYSKDENLLPLIEMEPLLINLPFSETDAQRIWDLAFKTKENSFCGPMDILIKIIKNLKANENSAREFAKIFAKNIEKVEILLKPLPVPKLQFNKVQAFLLFRYIAQLGDPIATLAIIKSDILLHIRDLFYKYPNHSIYLYQFQDFVETLINHSLKYGTTTTNPSYSLLKQLLIDSKFLARLILVFRSEYRKPITLRSGNFGFLTKIANLVQQAANTLPAIPQGVQGWSLFVKTLLEETNHMNKIPDFLKPPEGIKKKSNQNIVGDPGIED